jgi:hypothetical protein
MTLTPPAPIAPLFGNIFNVLTVEWAEGFSTRALVPVIN